MKTKKNIILLITIIITIFITGCNNSISNNSTNNIKTIVSCYKDFYLFHSKQRIKNIVYLNNDNKLIKYEYSEAYFDFDSNNEYTRTCDGLTEELNEENKKQYINAKTTCEENNEVLAKYEYDITKIPSKNILPKKEVKDYLNDDYILDLENYKANITSKNYTCENI